MGTILYDYLNESFLFDEKLISSNFSPLSENSIKDELKKYRKFCLDNLETIYDEIPNNRTNLTLFAGRTGLTIEQLKRSALYVEHQIIDDPIFELTVEQDRNRQAMSESLGYPPGSLDKEKLAKAALFLKNITPMIAANYVKLLPISKIYEPPKEIGINYSNNYFSELLPKPVLKFFHDRAITRSLKRIQDSWVVENKLSPCRGIFIEFEGHPGTNGFIYYLQEFKPLEFDDSTRYVRFEIRLPNDPPDQHYFSAWVFQSINQSANSFYKNTLSEYAISQKCNSSFLTRSQLVFDLLQLLGASDSGIKSHTTTSLLELDLPFMEDISLQTLMRVRQEDGEVFQNFRDTLERGFRELRMEDNPESLKIKTENLVHELTEIDVREIDRKIRSLKRIAGSGIALATIGLAGAVHTAGWSLLAAAAAIFQGFKSFEEYQKEVKLNPSYFLWKIKKDTR